MRRQRFLVLCFLLLLYDRTCISVEYQQSYFSMQMQDSIRASRLPCAKRYYPEVFDGNFVCVCNASYCDTIPARQSLRAGDRDASLSPGEAAVFTTSMEGARLELDVKSFKQLHGSPAKQTDGWVRLVVNGSRAHQKMLGFGGAFTDSAAITIDSLPAVVSSRLVQQYFGPNGARYSLGRVPMASNDFSLSQYSYDDTPSDLSLKDFKLADIDEKLKIPLIRRALELSDNELKLFASPWLSPAWMKTTGRMAGNGELIRNRTVYAAWARYFVRFFEEYAARNVSFWAATVQNEPTSGAVPGYKWQTMYWNATGQRDFIRDHLGPALAATEATNKIKLIGLDDNRFWLVNWAKILFSDPVVSRYVAGMGVHWYMNWLTPPSAIAKTLQAHPGKFVLATEACNGAAPLHGPILGDWQRAAEYAKDILETVTNGASGWLDWNLALDPSGGPTWVDNNVDAPILVNASSGEFLKQPMFYTLVHFSRFIRPNSVRVAISAQYEKEVPLFAAAFTLRGQRVLVIQNRGDQAVQMSVEDASGPAGSHISFTSPANSIQTILWSKPSKQPTDKRLKKRK